jgi:mono/diheme cytochrome c family protein
MPVKRSATLVAILGITLAGCQQAPTTADSAAGKVLFDQNCTVCHGPEGDIRQAAQYDPATPDLREITKRSAGGRFPRTTLISVIDGRKVVEGHDRGAMPVWGELLGEDDESTETQIRALVAYIESIQVR